MPQPTGSWKTSSGLLDDFDFDIEEAWFGVNEKFGEAVLLNLRGIASQEGEVVDDEHLLLYSCGDGWEAAKGGREAQHGAGRTTFTNQSNMGRLIDSIVSLGDDVIGVLSSRGETYEADTWEGLRFHIERKTFSFRDRETKEQVSYEVPLATDFLGEVETEAPAKAPAKAPRKPRGSKAEAEAPAEEAPAKAPRKPRGKKGNAALEKAILDAASEFEFDDHADFAAWVLDPDEFPQADELQADEEMAANVLDEDGSIWQKILAAQ